MQFYNNKIYFLRLTADLLIVGLSMLVSVLYIKNFDFKYTKPVEYLFIVYQLFSWYFIVKGNDLYNDSRSKKGLANEIFKSFLSIGILGITLIFLLFFVHNDIYGPRFVIFYISLLVIFIPIEKTIVKLFIFYLRKNGLNIKRIAIIGAGKSASRFNKLIQENTHFGYTVSGFVLENETDKVDVNLRILGDLSQLKEIINDHDIHELIVAIPNINSEKVNKLYAIANNAGVRMRIIPDYYHFYYNRFVVKNFGNIPVVSIRKEPLEEPHWQNVKRIFDIIFSCFVLIFFCSWMFPLIAIAIKLDSRGPVFYRQKRLGKNKVEFDCFKFRSMRTDNNADFIQATKNDPRITKTGAFLRKTSLDEFPQFLNVLLGHMSVVGPRPHPLKLNDQFYEKIDVYMVRQLVKPGITGWAQVNGYRGETKEEIEMINRIEHDIWYIENWFFLLDLKIIFLTFWNIFKGEDKAY